MRLAIRTLIVILLGITLSLGIYVAADAAFGQLLGPNGFNTNFVVLIAAWKGLGGSAKPLSSDAMGAAGGGMPAFAGGGSPFGAPAQAAATVPLTDGLDLAQAPRQTGSDLLWLGIPAVLAALVELAVTGPARRKRRQRAPSTRAG